MSNPHGLPESHFTNSAPQSLPANFIVGHYDIVKESKHPYLGLLKILKHQENGSLIFSTQRTYDSKSECCKNLIQTRARHEIHSKHYLSPIEYEFTEVSDFCYKFYQLNVFRKYHQRTLHKKMIKNLANIHKSIPNKEITFLLYDLICGMKDLQCNKIAHGKLSPDWIVKGKKSWKIVDDVFSNPEDLKNIERNSKNLFLSPEGFEYWSKTCGLRPKFTIKNLRPYSVCLDDVFALGLVILEFGIRFSVQPIYDLGNWKFDAEMLDSFVRIFENNYSDNILLVSTVKCMLEVNFNNRPNFEQIFDRLPERATVKEFFKNGSPSKAAGLGHSQS